MKKNLFQRMIRSKGAWIGFVLAILFCLLFLRASQNGSTFDFYLGYESCFFSCSEHKFFDLPDTNIKNAYSDGFYSIVSKTGSIYYWIYLSIIVIIFSFIGYFIETKLFKKRK